MIELKYLLEEEDYINFNLYHMKNSKSAVRALNIQRFITPVLFLIFSYLLSQKEGLSFPLMFVIFLILGILWFVYFPKYFYSHVIKKVKNLIKYGKHDDLLDDHTFVMTEEGIVDKTTNGETKASWSEIKSFNEDDHNFYLYNTVISAFILPKKKIKNVDEIRNYIAAKVGK